MGPIASPYGLHMVWVEAREPGAVPQFETVRGRVRERWLESARAARVADLLRELRRQTPLQVASISWRDQPGVSIKSQFTSSRTFCTRTQPDEWKRMSSPNNPFAGVSCM